MFNVHLLPRNLEACRRDFDHSNLQVRLSVVSDLTRGATDADRTERIDLLVHGLDDKNAEVRRRVLVALADLDAKSARDRVLVMLSDVEIRVRQMAVLCLGEIADSGDEEVVGRLASLLRAGDAAIRYQALIAHSGLRPNEAGDDLLVALSDPDAEVRELAVRLVDEVLVDKGLPLGSRLERALAQACDDEEPRVRLVAQLLCGDMAWDAPRGMIFDVIARKLRVREPRDEQTALQLAGKLSIAEATPYLRRRAFGRLGFSLDPFRWVALGSLCRLGDERALSKLSASLRSRNIIDRAMAAQSLADSGHPAALKLLRPLLGAPEALDPAVLSSSIAKLEAELGVGDKPQQLQEVDSEQAET